MRRFIVLTLALLTAAAALCGCVQESFVGRCEKNPDGYIAEFERMDGSDSHVLTLKKGDVLDVRITVDSGSLRLTIAGGNSILYAGNGTAASDFTLNIPSDGKYTVTLDARHAAGMVRITK